MTPSSPRETPAPGEWRQGTERAAAVPDNSAVDMHADRLGQTAADALHELCTAANGEGREYCMPLKLVVGESTGPVPEEL